MAKEIDKASLRNWSSTHNPRDGIEENKCDLRDFWRSDSSVKSK